MLILGVDVTRGFANTFLRKNIQNNIVKEDMGVFHWQLDDMVSFCNPEGFLIFSRGLHMGELWDAVSTGNKALTFAV